MMAPPNPELQREMDEVLARLRRNSELFQAVATLAALYAGECDRQTLAKEQCKHMKRPVVIVINAPQKEKVNE